MVLLVLLGSGFFLASVVVLDQSILLLALSLLFVCAGLFVRYRQITAYLVFTFLYPLLPSQSPFSPFDFLEFLFLCFAFWWAVQRIRERHWRLPVHPLTPALALIVLIATISVLLALVRSHYLLSEVFFLKLKENWNIFRSSPSTELAPLHSLIYLLEGVLFFYITIDLVDNSEKIRKTAKSILYSAALVSVLGIFQFTFKFRLLEYWIKENPQMVRINSTFSDPNSLGTYLVTIFCFGTFAYLSNLTKKSMVHLAILTTIFMALVFTASRAGLGAAFLCLFLLPAVGKWFGIDPFGYLRGPTLWVARRGPFLAVCAIVGLVLTAFVVNYQNPQPGSLFHIALFTFNPQLTFDQILKGRMIFWEKAVEVFREYPIFGCGLGGLIDRLWSAPYFLTQPENAHNYFLQILSETGLPGFLLFCALILLALRSAVRKLHSVDRGDFLLIYGFFCGFIAFLLTCFTGHPLLLLKLQFVFWSFLGLLVLPTNGASPATRSRPVKSAFLLITTAILLVAAFQIRSTLNSRRLSVYEYGYHGWENNEQGILFRWTGPDAISVMEVRGKVLSFHLRQLNPECLKKPMYVKVYLNNELLDTIHFSNFDWKHVKYFVPHLVTGTHATLRIHPEKSFVPVQSGSDRRKLGIAVGKFVWECSLPYPVGTHELEREGTKNFYWTRGQASFPLHVPGTTISFRLLLSDSSDRKPAELSFYWNDTLVKRLTLNSVQWENVSLRIPSGSREGIFTMRVSRTTNPKRMGKGADARDLSARISWPFYSDGHPVIFRTDTSGQLENAVLYGISNNKNHPLRLLSYPYESSIPNVEVFRSGVLLQPQTGLLDSISGNDKNWIRIFPKSGQQEFFVENKLTENVQLPHGPVVIRMTAMGTIAMGEVPVASLRIDDREVARQPILYADWTDYYFAVLLPEKGQKVSVEFLNDYYGPFQWMDRNLLIKEISMQARKQKPVEFKAGWQLLPNWILLAEPVDRDDPFSPQNYCYSISSHK